MKESALTLFRKRLIPEECVPLKKDTILFHDSDLMVTRWNALKPRPDLDHGLSCYYLNAGYKVSRFYGADGQLLYHYCDIITHHYDEESNALTVTDLLADVIIYPDGSVKVVDIGEIPLAAEKGLLSSKDLKKALRSLDKLLSMVYSGRLSELTKPMDIYDK